MSEPKLYRFKLDNMNLKDYYRNLKERAKNFRYEAEILITRAKEVERVANELEVDLIEAEGKSEK